VVIDPAEISPFKRWREVDLGEPSKVRELVSSSAPRNCVAFECVGVPGVLDSIVQSCERDTRILSAGGPPQGDFIHTMTAKRKGLNIQFGGGPSMHDWNEAFAEVDAGRMDVSPMLGRIIGLEEMPEAINDARSGRGPARIVVMPSR
jgi:threonine dehydrogenase-like Zn-dependent dehydrogenase